MKTENLNFPEAVEQLAGIAGMPMPERSPEDRRREDTRARLGDVMEAACKWYRAALGGARGAEGAAYLARRGLSAETVARFELGFAPNARDALFRHLAELGYSADAIIEAGLAGRPDDGRAPYDRFRDDRVMFPIRDARGRCIAFGGRALSPDARAKYLNSPETPLFHKSRVLYHHGPARAAAAKGAPVIVAEGYMDVIALAQAGFDAPVAPLGTAMTESHLELLWRMTDEPIIALDGDAAGRRAALRAAELATPKLTPGKSLRFALMPEGRDPDDLIREEGAEAMRAQLEAAIPLVDLLWDARVASGPLDTPERRAAFEAGLSALTDQITDPIVRAQYRDEFWRRRRDLFNGANRPQGERRPQDGRRRSGGPRSQTPAGPHTATAATALARAAAAPERGDRAELRSRECVILAMLYDHPAALEAVSDQLAGLTFETDALDKIKGALLSAALFQCDASAEIDADAVRRAVQQEHGAETMERIRNEAAGRRPPSTKAGAPTSVVERVVAETLTLYATDRARAEDGAGFARDLCDDVELGEGDFRRWGKGAEPPRIDTRDACRAKTTEDGGLDAFIASEPWIKRPKRDRKRAG